MNRARNFIAGLLAAQHLLSSFVLAAGRGPSQAPANSFIVPSEIHANESFTFAASAVVEGEVISVQKTDSEGVVEGEVITKVKPDRFGRIFVPAGLATGMYLLTRSSSKGPSRIDVQPPRNLTPESDLKLIDPPKVCNVKQGLTLHGQGLSGNAADLTLTIGERQVQALASTATEIKTGALRDVPFGKCDVQVTNNASGKQDVVEDVFNYDLAAKLTQAKITSGSSTALEFGFKPADTDATVNARILSGPISFAGGAKQKEAKIQKGLARLPLFADSAGVGKFQVAYDLISIAGVLMEPNNPQDNTKKERCPLTEHNRKPATGWKKTETTGKDPDTGKSKTVYKAERTLRCFVKSSCTKEKGHAGACNFTAEKKCKDDGDSTELKEFDTKEERDKFVKDNP